jgi:polyisoprenoid-binding protein YceI
LPRVKPSRLACTSSLLVATLFVGVACKKAPEGPPPPPRVPQPSLPTVTTSSVVELAVDAAASAVTFTMDAPLEKIHGSFAGGVSGELLLVPTELSASRGLVRVDVSKLELAQEGRKSADQAFGARVVEAKQNQHARAWLEITPDVPDAVLAENASALLAITGLTSTTTLDLAVDGERSFPARATGKLWLHGQEAEVAVDARLTVGVVGGKVGAVRVALAAPFEVGLEKHDVRPRDGFGKLASKTLAALGDQVGTVAKVQVELVAKAE